MAVTTSDILYPFDPTGALLSNRIVGEQQIVSPPNFRDFYFLIPKAAPFFGDSLVITLKDLENQSRPLIEGVDYYPTHRFISASRATAKAIYGSITLLDKELAGVVTVTYQTLGGIWTVNESVIAEILANTLLNPRITSWDMVVDLPIAFPPIDHEWDLVDMVGETELIAAIDRITASLNESGGNAITLHLADFNNPHKVGKVQVGLGLVENYGIATDAEAKSGLRNDVYMTALRVKAAVTQQAGALLLNHTADHGNPHVVTKIQVGLGLVDNFSTASPAEVVAGVLATKFVTPAGVKAAIDNFNTTTFQSHVSNKLNPHEVDKLQVGLALVENYAVASPNDAQAGSRNDVYMTPLRVRQAIQSLAGGDINAHVLDYGNPHQTNKSQIGLANVNNYGTADSATTLIGTATNLHTTPKGVIDAIKTLVANDFHEHAINTSNPHAVTAEQVGAYDKTAINNLLLGYLAIDGKAVNSTKFDGMVIDEYKDYVLAGKSASTGTFNQRNEQEYKDWVLTGKSADSFLLNGLDSNQIIALASSQSDQSGALAIQRGQSVQDVAVGAVNSWTKFASMTLPGALGATDGNPDGQWLLAGTDSAGDTGSDLWMVRCSVRGAGAGAAKVSIKALNLSGVASGSTFGFTYNATDKIAEIWVKSKPQRNVMSVTELNKTAGHIVSEAPVVVEPVGIIYAAAPDTLATVSQVADLENQMADAVRAITAAFTGMVPTP